MTVCCHRWAKALSVLWLKKRSFPSLNTHSRKCSHLGTFQFCLAKTYNHLHQNSIYSFDLRSSNYWVNDLITIVARFVSPVGSTTDSLYLLAWSRGFRNILGEGPIKHATPLALRQCMEICVADCSGGHWTSRTICNTNLPIHWRRGSKVWRVSCSKPHRNSTPMQKATMQ